MKRRKFIQTSLVGLPLVTLADTVQAGTEKRPLTVEVINAEIGGNKQGARSKKSGVRSQESGVRSKK